MSTSLPISIFAEPPVLSWKPLSVLTSILVHCTAISLLVFGLFSVPPIGRRTPAIKMIVRHVELEEPEHERLEAPGQASAPSTAEGKAHPAATEKPSAEEAALREVAQEQPAPQTLVQPDLPTPVILKEKIPLPKVVLWTPEKTPVKEVVAPLRQVPTSPRVTPSLRRPNEEPRLADLPIASSDLALQGQPILPGTSAPIVVKGPEQQQPPMVSSVKGSAQPTPAALMSLSDLQMAHGDMNLPPANQTAASNSNGALANGQAKDSAAAANTENKREDKKDERSGSGDARAPESSVVAGKANTTKAGPGLGAEGAPGNGGQGTTTHIALAHDGKFGAVIIGSSLGDKYPETADVWTGRMAYTVYMHVGLPKSWILQYSLPRNEEAAAGGSVTRMEAPWPYNIVRPNLAPGAFDADALMVHGFVNQSGRFEGLSVVFPPSFGLAQFVIASLAQWEFRPATQNGQNIKVEVLLIIPEVPEE